MRNSVTDCRVNFSNEERLVVVTDFESFINGFEAANDQVEHFQNSLFGVYTQCFQLKKKIVSNSSEPWYTEELRILKIKNKREAKKIK